MLVPGAHQRSGKFVVVPKAAVARVPSGEVGHLQGLGWAGTSAVDAHVLVLGDGGGRISRLSLHSHEWLGTDPWENGRHYNSLHPTGDSLALHTL